MTNSISTTLSIPEVQAVQPLAFRIEAFLGTLALGLMAGVF